MENNNSAISQSAETGADKSEQQLKRFPGIIIHPVYHFLVIIITIFLAETMDMFFLASLQPMTVGKEAFFDFLILVCMVFPVLYFMIVKPFRLFISERRMTAEKIDVYQKELRDLISKRSLIEEKERKLISEELHDNIGQNLALSKIKLDVLKASFAGNTKELEDIKDLIEQTIQFTKSLTFELSTPVLYQLGFMPAIAWLADQIKGKNGLEIELITDQKQGEIKGDASILLYKTVRELIMNVVKHAGASKAMITVSNDKDHIKIAIEDDGEGFRVADMETRLVENRSFGIFAIRERIKYLDGTLDISSEPGKGTKVTVTVAKNGITKNQLTHYQGSSPDQKMQDYLHT
jgi:signal transduction histidine kinase